MKSLISRLHEIRCGNPATKEEVIKMAEDLININNSRKQTCAWLIIDKDGHTYCTPKTNVALWEKSNGSHVTELTYK
jgi:hypothetical protein